MIRYLRALDRRLILGRKQSLNQNLRKAWEAACPAYPCNIEANAQERAATAAKARSPIGSFLALACGKVAIKVADAMDEFSEKLTKEEGDARKKAATDRIAIVAGVHDIESIEDGKGKAPARLSRLAALAREDVVDRRVLFHVDFSSTNDGGDGTLAENACNRRDREDGSRERRPFFSFEETVELVANQVKEMIAAKAAAIAIVSESKPSVTVTSTGGKEARRASSPPGVQPLAPPPPTDGEASGPPLRTIVTALSSLLGMEVEICENTREMAATLEEFSNIGDAGDCTSILPLRTRLLMAERSNPPGGMPLSPAEEPEMSDEEEERLPDFTWGGEGGGVRGRISCGYVMYSLHCRMEQWPKRSDQTATSAELQQGARSDELKRGKKTATM